MRGQHEFENLLCQIIEEHLPTSRQSGFSDWPSSMTILEMRSANYALHIVMAENAGAAAFGQTEAETTFTDLRRTLEATKRVLVGLSGGNQLQLACELSPSARLVRQHHVITALEISLMNAQMVAGERRARKVESQKVTPDEVARLISGLITMTENEADVVSEILTGKGGLDQFQVLLTKVLQALPLLEKEHRATHKASQKPNWRAAAVAGKCREVWAKENRESGSTGWQRYCENKGKALTPSQQFLSFAPTVQHHDSPGPFGRFLCDVLQALGMNMENGEFVSAAVALRQWKKAQSD